MNNFNRYDLQYHDTLTDLPNRLAIREQLEAAIQGMPGSFALLEIDIDGLKELNDTEGHGEGDRFLRAVGEVLDETLRSSDLYLPAHKSGDEFSIILYSLHTEEQVAIVRERVRSDLDDLGIGVSIGGRLHRVGESAEQLSEAADALMYDDKVRRKIEQYGYQGAREAIIAIGHIAITNNINLRDAPLLWELVQQGLL